MTQEDESHELLERNTNYKMLPRVSTNTIHGTYLLEKEARMFSDILKFLPEERIKILYVHSNKFEPTLDINNNIIVGVTTHRVFKFERGSKHDVMMQDIIDVKHQKNGIFLWDKLACRLKNNKAVSFGIYHGDACRYFCNYIRGHHMECHIEVIS